MTLRINPGRRLRRGLLVLGTTALVAACGGGTSQVQTFVAEQVYAFGDEASTLTADGRKYSVNVLTSDKAIDCAADPIWVQTVATFYGLVFAECNPDAVAEPKAHMAAVPGARIADLAPQIDAVVAAGGFGANTLATVMLGAHDVLDLYAQYPTLSEAELTAELRARGKLLAQQINRLVDLDVRVIVSTIPDLGRTPFAAAQKSTNTDIDRAALLSRLSFELNAGMRVNIVNDGRRLGLVLADEMVQAMVKSPGVFAIENATSAVCTDAVAPPDCSTDTLVDGGRSSAWLWADDRLMAYGGHRRLGLLAQTRARDNPF